MRAVVCHEPGDIDTLRLEEQPTPTPGEHEVRIAVRAAGVNFADILLTRGEYQEKPAHPFSPGLEVAGIVDAVGSVTRSTGGQSEERARGSRTTGAPAVGDRVVAFLDHGGFAEYALADTRDVIPLPDHMTFETAAAFPIVYVTSHLALRERGRLQAGEILLVHGASGGVGLAAVEIGKAIGATVIATASSPDKLALAAEHGANHLVNYASEDISERVRELTGGVDVVYDPVGGDAFDASLRVINPGGRLLVIGFASGTVPQIPANHLLVKDASALGLSVGQVRRHRPDLIREALRELLAWHAEGRLCPLVSEQMDLDHAVEALRALRDRRARGKLVLTTGAMAHWQEDGSGSRDGGDGR